MSVELNNYLLDVVFGIGQSHCQLRTYKIAAISAAAAYERWANEEATDFPIVYEGDVVPAIIVGIQQG